MPPPVLCVRCGAALDTSGGSQVDCEHCGATCQTDLLTAELAHWTPTPPRPPRTVRRVGQ